MGGGQIHLYLKLYFFCKKIQIHRTWLLLNCNLNLFLIEFVKSRTFNVSFYLEFTLNPLLRSRGVDEEGSQSLTRVILRPIS